MRRIAHPRSAHGCELLANRPAHARTVVVVDDRGAAAGRHLVVADEVRTSSGGGRRFVADEAPAPSKANTAARQMYRIRTTLTPPRTALLTAQPPHTRVRFRRAIGAEPWVAEDAIRWNS